MSEYFQQIYHITEEDIEPRYQHVHHARSLLFFEKARLAYLFHCGTPFDTLLDEGLFLVVTSIDISYKREVRMGPICVTCEQPAMNGKEMSMYQRILNEKGKTAVEATIRYVFLSGTTQRSIYPPESFFRPYLNPPLMP